MRRNMLPTPSARRENRFDGGHVAAPRFHLDAECPASLGREPVVLRSAVVIGRAPLAVDPLLLLETLECRVEGSLVDVENAARGLLNALADPPPGARLRGPGLPIDAHPRPRPA